MSHSRSGSYSFYVQYLIFHADYHLVIVLFLHLKKLRLKGSVTNRGHTVSECPAAVGCHLCQTQSHIVSTPSPGCARCSHYLTVPHSSPKRQAFHRRAHLSSGASLAMCPQPVLSGPQFSQELYEVISMTTPHLPGQDYRRKL
jgi:hypothetical protein